MELVMPPKIEAAQVFGTALYSANAVLAGRTSDVWELVTTISPKSRDLAAASKVSTSNALSAADPTLSP